MQLVAINKNDLIVWEFEFITVHVIFQLPFKNPRDLQFIMPMQGDIVRGGMFEVLRKHGDGEIIG